MFQMTGEGCEAATLYLQEIGKWEEFTNNETSVDGYSLVQWANVYWNRSLTTEAAEVLYANLEKLYD